MYSPYQFITSSVRLYCTLLLFFCSGVITASNKTYPALKDSVPQRYSFVAAQLCQDKKMNEAVETIELALKDEQESQDMYTWYVRGFIYKEKYKLDATQEEKNKSRDIAVESFQKSESIANKTNEATLNHNTALKYLASTYYNDALLTAGQLTNEDTQTCDAYLQKFHDITNITEPTHNFTNEDKVYHNAKAQRLYSLWLITPENNKLFESARQAFEQTLKLDPTDCSSQYNLGVLLYNRATNHFTPSATGALEKCCVKGIECQHAKDLCNQSLALFQQAYDKCQTAELKQALNVCKKALGMPVIE
jgi:hypothetical protein